MADREVWNLGGPIAAPAAGDRVPFATGPAAGGYSRRDDFVWRNAAGKYVHNGASANYAMNFSDVNPARGIIADFANNAAAGLNGAMISFTQNTINNWCIGQVPGANAFAIYSGRNGAADGNEVLRITSGGGVGIGTAAPAVRLHAKSSAEVARFETTTARGSGNNFMTWYDPTGRAGYLGWGATNNDLFFVNELAGDLTFSTAGSNIQHNVGGVQITITQAAGFRPGSDNQRALGAASFRWTVVYSATGTINTCDVRFKTFRTDRQLREAEHAAALALFDAFGFYQFNDAIEAKGADGARWHYGPAAQEAYQIWADHGLCQPLAENKKGDLVPARGAVPPAFICFDLIEEETAAVTEGWRPSDILGPDGQPVMVKCAEGEEATEQRPTGKTVVTREAGHIFGIRIDQMHSLMLAALNAERKSLAARIEQLEAAA